MTNYIPEKRATPAEAFAKEMTNPDEIDGATPWMNTLKGHQYMARSAQPETVIGFYASDQNRQALPFGPVTPDYQQELQGQRDEFLKDYEQAYLAYRGDIPASWLMRYGSDFLEGIRADNFIDLRAVYQGELDQAMEVERQAAITREADRRMHSSLVHHKIAEWFAIGRTAILHGTEGGREQIETYLQEYSEGLPQYEDVRRDVELEFSGRRDEIYDEDIAAFLKEKEAVFRQEGYDDAAIARVMPLVEKNIRSEIRSGGDAAAILGTKGAFQSIVDGGVNAFGSVISGAATGLGGVLWAVDSLTPGSGPYDWMVNQQRQKHEAMIAEYETQNMLPEDEMMKRAHTMGVQAAWETMPDEAPQIYDEYVRMAGGDQALAMGFFSADVADRPEAEEQLKDMVRELEEQNKLVIEDMREQDYRASDALLDGLAAWGRNVPGRLSTVFTLMLSDGDYWDDITQGKLVETWQQLNKDSEALGHTPAAALGLDGSMLGLTMDLGLGVAFDPTTWVLGPRFGSGAKTVAAASAKQAMNLAKGPMVRSMVDDIIFWAQSPSRGASSMYHMTSWLDSASSAELRSIIGWQNRMIPDGAWRATRAQRHGAQEVSVRSLIELLPEDDIARALGEGVEYTTQAVDDAIRDWGLGDDILKNGFNESGTITISRADGSIHFTDGVKRALAANEAGITHMPVKLQIVDDAARGNVKIAGFTPEESLFIKNIADEGVTVTGKVVPEGNELVRTGTLEAAQNEIVTNPGYGVGQVTTQAGNTMQVFRHTGDGWVQYYVQDAGGKVVAAVNGSPGKALAAEGGGISMAVNKALGRGVMDQIWDIASQNGDEFILQTGKSGSTSQQAMRFVEKRAAKLMEDATGVLHTSGRQLDELFPDGLKRQLKEAGSNPEVTIRPDLVLPGKFLFGDIDRAAVDAVIERAIMRGARPSDGARSAVLSSWSGRAKSAIKNLVPNEVRSLFTKMNTTTRFDLHGGRAYDDIHQTIVKLWGDDTAKVSEWMGRVYAHQDEAMRAVAANDAALAALRPLQNEVAALLDLTGGSWDDIFAMMGEDVAAYAGTLSVATDDAGIAAAKAALKESESALDAAKSNYAQAQDELMNKWKELEKRTAEIHKGLETMPDQKALSKLIEEMWNEYNATYIMPRWKKVAAKNPEIVKELDDGTKIIDWEHLKRGRIRDVEVPLGVDESGNWLPRTLREQAEAAGIADPEKMVRYLNNILETPMAMDVPISPLDMIAASTRSGKGWTRWTQTATGHAIREATNALHKVWVVDKVLRPATAMTVSGDELLRIFHKGGNRAIGRYLSDRALFTQARVQAALHGSNPFAREAVQKGSRYSARVQNRLQKLSERTLRSREWERIFYDDHGFGWTDIQPGDPIYYDAAKRWTGGMIQQSGFRAFLRGEDAFRDWFYSVDGEQMRNATILSKKGASGPTTGVVASVEDAYKGWKTLFDDVILAKAKKQGVYDEVREAFLETAAKVDASPTHAVDLPDWVFDHMGAVRGVQKLTRKKTSPFRMTDAFFDRFFLDPVNYRRGFVGEMVGKHEAARLEGLFASQGIRVVPDAEVAHMLGFKGMGGASRTGVADFLNEQALKRGIVTQSHFDNLVQRAVDAETEHMLYVAEQGRRIGATATGTLFPFGKPYADMAGFWAREMFRRPHYRGFINEENYFNLGNLFTARGNFNPRTPALISRLAHTDFTIDAGWAGEVENGETKGLLPGSEETDLSPLLFLPTAGENPFYSMIPGMGYLPMWALDMILADYGDGANPFGVDPDEDPEGYQALVDSVGDVIAGAHFGNPNAALSLSQRFIGGGTLGQSMEVGMDLMAIFGDSGSFGAVSTVLGQPDREIDRGRMISAIFSDPEEWDELFSLTDAESIELYFDALANEADEKAALGNLSEQLSRFMLPTNNKYSGELDDIWEVWITAGDRYDFLSGRNYDDESASPEERRQRADDIRSAFFDLPQWQRDRIVAETPQVAVNLVSSWDWTDLAHDRGIDGTELAYRTEGSREGLARHQLYINQGLIRPLAPQERLRRIVGLQINAVESNAKRVYTDTARQTNEQLWESFVSDQSKLVLDVVMNEAPELAAAIGVETAKELWEAWGSYETDFEEFLAMANDIALEKSGSRAKDKMTEYDRLRDVIKIPQNEKPWGTTWPGTDPDSLPDRFAQIIPEFSQEAQLMADAAGVELTPGMTGEQLYNGLQAVITGTGGPLAAYVMPAYDAYIGERSVATRIVDEELGKIARNQRYSEEWRTSVSNFMEFVGNTADRYREAVLGVPPERQLEIQQRFMQLKMTADDNVIADWDQLWRMRYERSYGPLGWVPPEPLSPFDADGNVQDYAYQPYIRHIIDGDSFVVRNSAGSEVFHEVRLLGTRARDFGLDDAGAMEDKDRLWDALQQARQNGDRIYLVRQPDVFGNVDMYGRELAWLWIGDEPYYYPEELLPNRDPSGGEN